MYKPLLISAIIVFTATAFSHGEDKPGPHGGFIKMPSGFHTEVVPVGNNQLKVYLLDIDWKNPTTDKSTVRVNATVCAAKDSYFICDLGKIFNLKKKGKLTIEATRLEQKGNTMTYDLPLTWPKSKEDHSRH